MSTREGKVNEFTRKALDLALAWPKHDQTKLSGISSNGSSKFPRKTNPAVWDLIDAWVASEADESAKADLGEIGFAGSRSLDLVIGAA